jgi:hypothetical protein
LLQIYYHNKVRPYGILYVLGLSVVIETLKVMVGNGRKLVDESLLEPKDYG